MWVSGSASTSDDESTPSDEDEGCPTNKDQPHLRFEITSDDGFSVEADSVEGKLSQEERPSNLYRLILCLTL